MPAFRTECITKRGCPAAYKQYAAKGQPFLDGAVFRENRSGSRRTGAFKQVFIKFYSRIDSVTDGYRKIKTAELTKVPGIVKEYQKERIR